MTFNRSPSSLLVDNSIILFRILLWSERQYDCNTSVYSQSRYFSIFFFLFHSVFHSHCLQFFTLKSRSVFDIAQNINRHIKYQLHSSLKLQISIKKLIIFYSFDLPRLFSKWYCTVKYYLNITKIYFLVKVRNNPIQIHADKGGERGEETQFLFKSSKIKGNSFGIETWYFFRRWNVV